MLKKSLTFLFVILILSFTAFGQKVYTPEKGSAERTAIFNSLRVPVEKELKQKIQFAAQTFNVSGTWTFVSGTLQNTDGGAPDFNRTKYKDAIDDGVFDNNFQALLKKTGGKWKVMTYLIGCTDVCWIPWKDDYKAPKAIFPN